MTSPPPFPPAPARRCWRCRPRPGAGAVRRGGAPGCRRCRGGRRSGSPASTSAGGRGVHPVHRRHDRPAEGGQRHPRRHPGFADAAGPGHHRHRGRGHRRAGRQGRTSSPCRCSTAAASTRCCSRTSSAGRRWSGNASASTGSPTSWTGSRFDNFFLLPTMVFDIVHADRDLPFDGVKSVLVAGQAISWPVRRAFEQRYQVPILVNYGSTEAGHIAGWNGRDMKAGRWKPGSAGRVYPGVELEIRDDAGTALPTGAEGEVVRPLRTDQGVRRRRRGVGRAGPGRLGAHRRHGLRRRRRGAVPRRPQAGHDQVRGVPGLARGDRGRTAGAPAGA